MSDIRFADGSIWFGADTLNARGNTLLIGASCACAIALTWGGVQFSWSSASVLVPLCLSAVVFCVWGLYEWRFFPHPIVRPGAHLIVHSRD